MRKVAVTNISHGCCDDDDDDDDTECVITVTTTFSLVCFCMVLCHTVRRLTQLRPPICLVPPFNYALQSVGLSRNYALQFVWFLTQLRPSICLAFT